MVPIASKVTQHKMSPLRSTGVYELFVGKQPTVGPDVSRHRRLIGQMEQRRYWPINRRWPRYIGPYGGAASVHTTPVIS
jgi:hypothetical protein